MLILYFLCKECFFNRRSQDKVAQMVENNLVAGSILDDDIMEQQKSRKKKKKVRYPHQ